MNALNHRGLRGKTKRVVFGKASSLYFLGVLSGERRRQRGEYAMRKPMLYA
jgi:hypothetical protein